MKQHLAFHIAFIHVHKPNSWKQKIRRHFRQRIHIKEKNMLSERILQRVHDTFPLTNIHVRLTPVTFSRFIHRALGKVGGYIPNGALSLLSTYSPKTNVEELWLCGDTVFLGAGSISCASSGWIVADAIDVKNSSMPKHRAIFSLLPPVSLFLFLLRFSDTLMPASQWRQVPVFAPHNRRRFSLFRTLHW